MKKAILIALSAFTFVAACGQKETVRDRISIVGSSTVFPFASAVAEAFGPANNGKVPKVESTGTGGGIKIFCSSTGLAGVDVANASRKMKKSEFETCGTNGIKEIIEVKIGFDGIVLANAKSGATLAVDAKDLYLALAKEIPVNGALVANPNKTWADVNPKLPAVRIEVMGPPPTSGTRDAFAEMILEKGAEKIDFLKAMKEKDAEGFKKVAMSIREDGAWKDMGENDNLIVQALANSKDAYGVFGFSFFEENMDKLKAAEIGGKAPTKETIMDGSYPAARSLYFYVKKANVSLLPSLKGYMTEFVSQKALGDKGYLVSRGLIPLPADELAKQSEIVNSLSIMTAPEK